MACEKCGPFGGKWVKGERGGMERCDCEDGRKLKEADEARKTGAAKPPRISKETAAVVVEAMSSMPFFPTAAGARFLIGEEIRSMCENSEEAFWLAQRMAQLYKSWPGPREMRLVYCGRHRPLDGVDIIGISDFYPDGIPTEAETMGLLAREQKFLPPPKGEPVSAAPSIDLTMRDLARAKDMRQVKPVHVHDIPILSPGQRVTQADVDAALLKLHEAAASAEAAL
jgi:hypothetical protein